MFISITEAAELRPDMFAFARFVLNRFLGVGGRGELAWRFSGFGDPKLPTELVQLDDEACREWATFKMSACVIGSSEMTLCRGDETFEMVDVGGATVIGWLVNVDVAGWVDVAIALGNDGGMLISTEIVTDSCGWIWA